MLQIVSGFAVQSLQSCRTLWPPDVCFGGTNIMSGSCTRQLFNSNGSHSIEMVEDLEPLPDIDFNIRAGNTLVGYAQIDDIDRHWTATGQLQLYRDHDKLEAM